MKKCHEIRHHILKRIATSDYFFAPFKKAENILLCVSNCDSFYRGFDNLIHNVQIIFAN